MKRMIGVMVFGLMACGGDSAQDDPAVVVNNSTNNAPQVSCADECAQKAAQCQAPPEQIGGLCASFCASGDAAALVTCLRTNSCETLADAFERGPETVCQTTNPPADMGTPTPDMPVTPDMSSGSCQIGRRECTGDYDALRCERSSRDTPVEVTERCAMPIPNVSPGTVCEDGWCVDATLVQVGSSCNDKSECRVPNDCQGGFCCQVAGERCTASDQCCGGEACVDTSFGYKVCKGIQ
jgi:hypothetical protein